MEVGGQRHAHASLPPGKIRYPLYMGLVGHQGRFRRVRKTLPPTGIQSPDRPASSESLYSLSYPRLHGCHCIGYNYVGLSGGLELPLSEGKRSIIRTSINLLVEQSETNLMSLA